jgi:hypothetical protein
MRKLRVKKFKTNREENRSIGTQIGSALANLGNGSEEALTASSVHLCLICIGTGGRFELFALTESLWTSVIPRPEPCRLDMIVSKTCPCDSSIAVRRCGIPRYG